MSNATSPRIPIVTPTAIPAQATSNTIKTDVKPISKDSSDIDTDLHSKQFPMSSMKSTPRQLSSPSPNTPISTSSGPSSVWVCWSFILGLFFFNFAVGVVFCVLRILSYVVLLAMLCTCICTAVFAPDNVLYISFATMLPWQGCARSCDNACVLLASICLCLWLRFKIYVLGHMIMLVSSYIFMLSLSNLTHFLLFMLLVTPMHCPCYGLTHILN